MKPGFVDNGALARKVELESFAARDGDVIEGVLREGGGRWYPILRGVPCFLRGALRPDLRSFCEKYSIAEPRSDGEAPAYIEPQALTRGTFSDKWSRFRDYGIDPGHQQFLFGWYCKKLNVPDVDALRGFYRGKESILEVGPGSGFNTRFIAENTAGSVIALDISDAAFTTFENTRHFPNCHVVQADLMDSPLRDEAFDFVIADGVLHHTPDTKAAVCELYGKVKPGGQFFFYVYRKMGEARQFCDRHVRAGFTGLATEDCYAACEGITELGRELSKLKASVTLEKGIPILGIPAGTHDVQRLVYYNFLKCFWNDAFDFETNNMVNFDWYHPHYAWQHTEEEVAGWLRELGVVEFRFHDANPNGISVLLTKP